MQSKLLSVVLLLKLGLVLSVVFNPDTRSYEELTVVISPDVPKDVSLLDKTKIWLESGNGQLFKASRETINIKSARIIVPANWDYSGARTVSHLVAEKADIRIEKEVLYGDLPYTVQPLGCGKPAKEIQVPVSFLRNVIGKAVNPVHGNMFVHHWAKYRYGVFEEFGYPGDAIYPSFFYATIKNQQNRTYSYAQANLCSSDDRSYKVESYGEDGCRFDPTTGLPDANCVAVHESNSDILSSVMAHPYIEGSGLFCNATEELPHDKYLPNRQNLICNKISIQDVVNEHSDFESKNKTAKTSVEVEYIKVTENPTAIVVIDPSTNMNDHIDLVKDALLMWIDSSLDSDFHLGLVTCQGQSIAKFDAIPMDAVGKGKAKTEISKLGTQQGSSTSEATLRAIEMLSSRSGGSIVVISGGKEEEGSVDVILEKLLNAGIPLVFISMGNDGDDRFTSVADRTLGKAFAIPDNKMTMLLNALDVLNDRTPVQKLQYLTYRQAESIRFILPTDHLDYSAKTVNLYLSDNVENVIISLPGNNVMRFEDAHQASFEWTPQSANDTVNMLLSQPVKFASVSVHQQSGGKHIALNCWSSIGTKSGDLVEEKRVSVHSFLSMDNRPILNAEVKVLLYADDNLEPTSYRLYDNGAGSDMIAHDGIYSAYVTGLRNVSDEIRYSPVCFARGGDRTVVDQRLPFSSANPSANLIPFCCGSNTYVRNELLSPVEGFSRYSIGEAISITNAMHPKYTYTRIRDFSVHNINVGNNNFELCFTAPGKSLDTGMMDSYTVWYSAYYPDSPSDDGLHTMLNGSCLFNATEFPPPQEFGTQICFHVSLDEFRADTPYYFWCQGVFIEDIANFTSKSNIARLYHQTRSTPIFVDDDGMSAGGIAGVCIAVIVLVVALVVAALYWRRKRSMTTNWPANDFGYSNYSFELNED